MKQSAVIELCMRQGSAQLLAQELGASRPSLYNWKNQLLGHDVSATDRQWLTPFVGGSYQFLDNGARLLDARVMFFYAATGITPAMSESRPGTGSAYAFAARDANAAYLDGSRTYKVTLAGPVPAKDFWSFTVYDNQTRSLLATDQKLAGIDSTLPGIKKNPDGGATIWFGPKAPAGEEKNWVQTMPGKGYNVLLRLYGPLEPWFNQSWRPSDFELQP